MAEQSEVPGPEERTASHRPTCALSRSLLAGGVYLGCFLNFSDLVLPQPWVCLPTGRCEGWRAPG